MGFGGARLDPTHTQEQALGVREGAPTGRAQPRHCSRGRHVGLRRSRTALRADRAGCEAGAVVVALAAESCAVLTVGPHVEEERHARRGGGDEKQWPEVDGVVLTHHAIHHPLVSFMHTKRPNECGIKLWRRRNNLAHFDDAKVQSHPPATLPRPHLTAKVASRGQHGQYNQYGHHCASPLDRLAHAGMGIHEGSLSVLHGNLPRSAYLTSQACTQGICRSAKLATLCPRTWTS